MKVVIELIGNESVNELLSASNFLRDLAGEGGRKIVDTQEQTKTDKTDLDKLADQVAEAAQVKEDAPKAPRKRTKSPAKEPDPAPTEEDKVKDEAPKTEEPAPTPTEETKVEDETGGDKAAHTIDDCKSWAMKALNAKKRPIVQEAFEHVGASSFPTLKESMFADFVEYISSRL